MLKSDVTENPDSCLNRAHDQEQLFVLLGRDPAAPVAIRAWIAERLRLGKNAPGDEQIREAFECATLMELQRGDIGTLRGQQQLRWSVGGGGTMTFAISRFASFFDRVPLRQTTSWRDLVTELSTPQSSPCSHATCAQTSCLYKRGACWSPALYSGVERRRQSVEALTLLVFDLDRVTEDQFDTTRGLISGLQYLVHATHSDRPDSRCLRFVFPLTRTVFPEEWLTFWEGAQLKLMPGADPACADMTRVYFFPSCPRDVSYFIQANEGALLDVDAVLMGVPQYPPPVSSDAVLMGVPQYPHPGESSS